MTTLSSAEPEDRRWPDPRIAALVPAFRPPDDLRSVIDGLCAAGCATIVVVDDGSGAEYAPFFAEIERSSGVTLIAHAENRGKGAALKTGLAALMSMTPPVTGVVTLDADGQHRPADAVRVAAALVESPESVILGARTFDERVRIPWRSRFGNLLTRALFRFFHGRGVEDTQTGLRGLPRSFFGAALDIATNRYDYELDMLICALERKLPIVNLPIETVYLDGNRSSHFNPVLDSLRIYFSLLRFSISALVAVALDFLVFSVALAASGNIAVSMASGRVLALGVNFSMNRSFVFRYRRNTRATLAKYLALAVLLAVLSYILILFMAAQFGLPPVVAKAVAESVLFLFSFLTQRHIVFAGGEIAH